MRWRPGDGLSSLLMESLQALESAIDGLRRLDTTIRLFSASILTQRINSFNQKNDDGSLEDLVYVRIKHLLVDRAKVDEIQGDEIKGAAPSLVRQLVESVLFRYFGILHRRSHEKKISTKREDKSVQEQKEQDSTPKSGSVIHPAEPSESAPSFLDSKSSRRPSAAKTVISIQPKDVKYPDLKSPRRQPMRLAHTVASGLTGASMKKRHGGLTILITILGFMRA